MFSSGVVQLGILIFYRSKCPGMCLFLFISFYLFFSLPLFLDVDCYPYNVLLRAKKISVVSVMLFFSPMLHSTISDFYVAIYPLFHVQKLFRVLCLTIFFSSFIRYLFALRIIQQATFPRVQNSLSCNTSYDKLVHEYHSPSSIDWSASPTIQKQKKMAHET